VTSDNLSEVASQYMRRGGQLQDRNARRSRIFGRKNGAQLEGRVETVRREVGRIWGSVREKDMVGMEKGWV